MPVPREFAEFWAEAQQFNAVVDDRRFYEAFAFGDSDRMACELAALVMEGTKQATASLAWSYEFERKPRPKPGDQSIVTTWAKAPLCIIETTAVDVVPFDEISEDFARTEGEGDRTLESWRRNHSEFFARECARIGKTPGPRMEVVCESFRLLYRGSASGAA
jgi:uncharacterized protein YhfF